MRIVRNLQASTASTPAPSTTDKIAEQLAERFPEDFARKIAQPHLFAAMRHLFGVDGQPEQPARTEGTANATNS